MELQVVSSLSALPLVNVPFSSLCTYYSDVKKNYPVAKSLLNVVENNVLKIQHVAAPILEKFHPQIEKADKYANERLVKLIDYCGPIVKKTPEELKTETKKRVSDVVETARSRAHTTQQQIYIAPSETVKMGRDMIATRYRNAVEVAGNRARKLRADVPTMIPANARTYFDNIWTNYGQYAYNRIMEIAGSSYALAQKTYRDSTSNFSQRIPSNLSSDVVTPLRDRIGTYWIQTSKNFHATSDLIFDSYYWLRSSRLAAISTARQMIDNSVGAVWEYASDLTKELSETYSKGSSSELFQLAARRLRNGRDIAAQLARWSYGEIVALQDASTSVLDVILSSWLFHWLTFQPVIGRLPEIVGHEMEQPAPIAASSSAQPRTGERGPFVPPVAGEPHPQGVSVETAQKLHESMNEDDDDDENDENEADDEPSDVD